MTQTSEVPSLHDLLSQAQDLSFAIGNAMDAIRNDDGPHQPDEWAELHIASKAAGITCDQLGQMIRRQDAASQPIPYIPAPVASCGHPADDDGECGCASWPERAPLESL